MSAIQVQSNDKSIFGTNLGKRCIATIYAIAIVAAIGVCMLLLMSLLLLVNESLGERLRILDFPLQRHFALLRPQMGNSDALNLRLCVSCPLGHFMGFLLRDARSLCDQMLRFFGTLDYILKGMDIFL
jgi:hypothetical protein